MLIGWVILVLRSVGRGGGVVRRGGQWVVGDGGLGSDNTDQELLLVSDVFCVSSLN